MRVVAAQPPNEPAEPLRQVLLGQGLECAAGDCVAVADLPARLARPPAADLVLVHVAAPGGIEALQQAKAHTGATLLAVGPTADPKLILDALHHGAREFLDISDLQGSLERALQKLQAAGEVKVQPCRLVAVASATPGGGVSTVAANLAFTWADTYKNGVALVELGREPASLALSLDMTPHLTTADLVANWQRLDVAALKKSLTAHAGGVHVLPHPPEALEPAPLDPAAVRKTVLLLRTLYKAAVLDLGSRMGPEHYEALRLCDAAVIVVRLDVPGLRQTRRFVKQLEDQGVPESRLRLVANRFGQGGQVPWKKAEEAIGAKFAAFLPEDGARLNHALNQGRPAVRVSRYGRFARRFARLAVLLNGKS
jgi:pilus assembly protein CpaE